MQSVPKTLLVCRNEGVFVVFPLATLRAIFPPAINHRNLFGSRPSGILITWPVHLSCANFKTLCMFCNPAFFMTSVLLLDFNSCLKQLCGNGIVCLHGVGILSRSHMHTRGLRTFISSLLKHRMKLDQLANCHSALLRYLVPRSGLTEYRWK